MKKLLRAQRTSATALALVAALTTVRTAALTAQAGLNPGDSIRIHRTNPDTVLHARLVSIDEGGLVYRLGEGADLHVSRESVASIEVGHLRSHARAGVVAGALSGAVVLGIIANTTYEGDGFIFDRRDETTMGAAVGALLGGLIGGLIGSSIKTESWKPVVLPWSGGSKSTALGMRVAVGHGVSSAPSIPKRR